ALVGHAVKIVQLAHRLQILTLRVEMVGAAPHRRLVDAFPLRALQDVLDLPVAAAARLAPAVAQTVDPHPAAPIPEARRAGPPRAGAQDTLAPVNSIGREVNRKTEAARLPV